MLNNKKIDKRASIATLRTLLRKTSPSITLKKKQNMPSMLKKNQNVIDLRIKRLQKHNRAIQSKKKSKEMVKGSFD
jgi:hypothetical protein